MQKIIFVSLFATALASLQGYVAPRRESGGISAGGVGGVSSGQQQQQQIGGGFVSGGFDRAAGGQGEVQTGHSSGSGPNGGSAVVDRFSGSSGFDISTAEGFGGSANNVGGFDAGSSSGGYEGGSVDVGSSGSFGGRDASSCAEGQILDIRGNCVVPEIVRNIYHYTAPQAEFRSVEEVPIPTPKLQYNVVFVRTPEALEGQEPIVVPPPQQKTIVYVLHKESDIEGPETIEIPATPHKPEVYYVNYNDGENPTLPIGIDLQSALARAVNQQGQTVASGAVGGETFEIGVVGGGSTGGGRFEGSTGVDSVSVGSFDNGAVGGGSLDVRGFGSGGQVNGGYQTGGNGGRVNGGPPPSTLYQSPRGK